MKLIWRNFFQILVSKVWLLRKSHTYTAWIHFTEGWNDLLDSLIKKNFICVALSDSQYIEQIAISRKFYYFFFLSEKNRIFFLNRLWRERESYAFRRSLNSAFPERILFTCKLLRENLKILFYILSLLWREKKIIFFLDVVTYTIYAQKWLSKFKIYNSVLTL